MNLTDEDKQWIQEGLKSVLNQIEATETRLLTAFHDWARTYEVRARGVTTAVAGFEERLGYIEERVGKLERGETGPKKPKESA